VELPVRSITAAFLAHFATFGPAYSYGVFGTPMADTLGLSGAEYSVIGGLATTLMLATSGVTGRLADRMGARRLMQAGAFLVGLGLAGTAVATNLALLVLSYVVLFGLGMSLCFVPSLAAVAHRRPSRPSLAAGLAASGAGVGTLLVAPGAAVLVDAVDWRVTVAVLAVGATAVLLVAAALVDRTNAPDRKDDLPEGSSRGARLLLAGMVLAGFGYYVPFVQLVPSVLDRGSSLGVASLFLFVLGMANVGGRVVLGGAGDSGAPSVWLAGAVTAMALGCLLLAPGAWVTTLVGAAVFGASAGAFVAFVPVLAAHIVGPARAGAQIGRFYAGLALGSALGPLIAGWLGDGPGGFPTAFLAAVAVLVLSAAAFSVARNEPAVSPP
jgi:MFS transporter, OFA family, oxalate/formate antiporter